MNVAEATVVLMIPCDVTLTEEVVRSAHRRVASSAHPDAGGTDDAMAMVNAARDLLLDEVGAPRVPPRCVCLGFKRNPMCPANHGDEVPRVVHEANTKGNGTCVCRGFFRNPLCPAHG